MHPVLIDIGGFTVSTFGIMMVAGFVVGWVLLSIEFARKGYRLEHAQAVILIAAAGGVVGAKVYYLLDHWQDLSADFFGMVTSRGGLTWYGGFVLATLLLILFVRSRRIPVLGALDAMAPALMLGYAIGRIGCFLVGDDYGKESNLPWAVAFPEGAPPIDAPVHPTQVYEALASSAIFVFLWRLRKKPAPDGTIVFTWFVLAGLERFAVEFLRRNDPMVLGLTQAQLLSLAMIALGAVGLAFLWSNKDGSRPAEVPVAARP